MSSTFILEKTNPNRANILTNACEFLRGLPQNKSWQVEVKEYRKKRTNPQNAWLWGVAYQTLEEATGQEADDWHEYMLGEWSGWETVDLFGKKKLRPRRRSSKLTTEEFDRYKMFIQKRASDYGIYIPDPQEEIPEYARAA